MKAILLCAGRGSRLLPLTQTMPKCLVPVDGKAILDHQIENFQAIGVTQFIIVGGYYVDAIRQHIQRYQGVVDVELIHNPFWSVTSSIASLWLAREHMGPHFFIANGDVILSAAILAKSLGQARSGINLLVEQSDAHIDDMRVVITPNTPEESEKIAAVGKSLDSVTAAYRSLGVILCDGGGDAYRQKLEAIVAEEGGPQLFHHEVIHRLAEKHMVTPLHVDGHWMEIDSPADIALWHEKRNIFNRPAPLQHTI